MTVILSNTFVIMNYLLNVIQLLSVHSTPIFTHNHCYFEWDLQSNIQTVRQ